MPSVVLAILVQLVVFGGWLWLCLSTISCRPVTYCKSDHSPELYTSAQRHHKAASTQFCAKLFVVLGRFIRAYCAVYERHNVCVCACVCVYLSTH